MKLNKILALWSLALATALSSYGQDKPIGYWRSHLPYNKAFSIAFDGGTVYVATEQSFYTYGVSTSEITTYSKAEGMADIGMSYVGYDAKTKTAVLAYKNSNIDLFSNGSFFNIPDLKLKSFAGSKNINHIYTDDGFAYLSTDIGIMVLNLDKKEVKETYTFARNGQVIPVTGVTLTDDFLFASTRRGLYRAPRNSPALQDFSKWTKIDTSEILTSVAAVGEKVFVTNTDTIFTIENNALKYVYRIDSNVNKVPGFIYHLDGGNNHLWISENYENFRGRVKKMDMNYNIVDSFRTEGYSHQVAERAGGSAYVADIFYGLKSRDSGQKEDNYTVIPKGPTDFSTFNIFTNNKEVWVAHGGHDEGWKPIYNRSGFSQFKDEDWKLHAVYHYPPFGDTTFDFVKIIKGPDGNVYAGSNQSGLFVLKPDGSYEIYKQDYFDESFGAPGTYRVTGLAFDNNGNLWMNVFGGNNELVVKAKDGNWYKYPVTTVRPYPHAAAHLIIDDNNQKWYASPRGGGVIVYDDKGTLDNTVDDDYKQLLSGKGAGGLPDNEVYVLAKDQNGAIWIGTANGIGIVNCPGSVLSGECESELRIVQYDEFAGYLFQNEQVVALAVDGGNRKWVGTNNGVWLLSPEGDKIILRFTENNSPLPSNRIQTINIDKVTGDVYIGTEKGLVSYRGTATEGAEENGHVVSFPNPVPSGYSGTIAIKGLVENADVRITDISGQLVYRTKALGGQAVWNGLDYTGRRPQSGVYLIFITNKDGSQTHAGKMIFME